MEFVIKKNNNGFIAYLPSRNILAEGETLQNTYDALLEKSQNTDEMVKENFLNAPFKGHILRSEISRELFKFSSKTLILLTAFAVLLLFLILPIFQRSVVYTKDMVKAEVRASISKSADKILNADAETLKRRRERLKGLYGKLVPFYEDFSDVFKEIKCD